MTAPVRPNALPWLLLSALVIVLDQLTKVGADLAARVHRRSR